MGNRGRGKEGRGQISIIVNFFFFGQVTHRQFLFSQKICLRKLMAVSLETPSSLSVSLLLAMSSGFYTLIPSAPPTPRQQQQQTIRKIMLSRPPPLQRAGLAKATLFDPTPKHILVKLMSQHLVYGHSTSKPF